MKRKDVSSNKGSSNSNTNPPVVADPDEDLADLLLPLTTTTSNNSSSSNDNHRHRTTTTAVTATTTTLVIQKSPPFYRQFWFWAFSVLLIMVGGLLTSETRILQNFTVVASDSTKVGGERQGGATATSKTVTRAKEPKKIVKETKKTTEKKGSKQQQQQQPKGSKSKSGDTAEPKALAKKGTKLQKSNDNTTPTAKTVPKQVEKGSSNQANVDESTKSSSSSSSSSSLKQQQQPQSKIIDAETTTTTKATETSTKTKDTSAKTATLATSSASSSSSSADSSSASRGLSPTEFAIRYLGFPVNFTVKTELAQQWGQWSLPKDTKAPRPALPCDQYKHCDVPRTKFPKNAWQTDAKFLETFLSEAQALVTRAQEVILAEYGQSKSDKPDKTFEQRSKNFQLTYLTLDGKVHPPDARKVAIDNGGWTTPRSFQGLVRRVLHAIVTQDTFTFVLGGHSSAAGHANLFKQSYAMQFHRVMEPIFSRLGVKLHSYNFAKGGIGTTQDSMGMASLWGRDIDFCMWDSGMTEHKNSHYDIFARQALIGGNRVPILWNGYLDILEVLHREADVDVGAHGTGLLGLPVTESEEQAKTLPYAAQFIKCTRDRKDMCDEHMYNARCWVNRRDWTPPTKQGWAPGHGGRHHPGFRIHQLTGRVLAFTVLTAMQEAIKQWKDAPKFKLPDSAWHVAAHYDNIRTKLAKLTTTPCFNETTFSSPRLCSTPMKAVSEYMPRARPETNSIRSIMTDTSYVQLPKPNVYFGRDVYNPALEPPPGAVNYLAIIENDRLPASSTERRQLLSSDNVARQEVLPVASSNNNNNHIEPVDDTSGSGGDELIHGRRLKGTTGKLPIGRGWALHIGKDDLPCNGTYDSECGRTAGNPCLLYGHNDGKGGLAFDSFSGWMLMRLKGVKHGLIIIKLETWIHPNSQGKWSPVESSELTEGWTEENNGDTSRRRRRRRLAGGGDGGGGEVKKVAVDEKIYIAPEPCPEFEFDYAINGNIKTLPKDKFFEMRGMVQSTVETWPLLDDPDFTSGKEMDVELGIRMRGCERKTSFKLTHVYWA